MRAILRYAPWESHRPPPRYDALVQYISMLRGAWAPLAGGVLLLAVLGGIVLLSQSVGAGDVPPEAPPFQPPPSAPVSAADIKLIDGVRLVIVRQTRAGTTEQELNVPAAAAIERLQAVAPADVVPGDWLTVVGVPNDVKNFSVLSLVILPGAASPGDAGVARSPAGFAGHEPMRDPRARPILGGPVLRVEDNVITIVGPTGEIRVTAGLEAPARLYRIEPASISDMREGDQIAGEFDSDMPSALLLLPATVG